MPYPPAGGTNFPAYPPATPSNFGGAGGYPPYPTPGAAGGSTGYPPYMNQGAGGYPPATGTGYNNFYNVSRRKIGHFGH